MRYVLGRVCHSELFPLVFKLSMVHGVLGLDPIKQFSREEEDWNGYSDQSRHHSGCCGWALSALLLIPRLEYW